MTVSYNEGRTKDRDQHRRGDAANLDSFGEAVISGKRIERPENDRATGGPAFDRVVYFHRSVSPDRQLGRLRRTQALTSPTRRQCLHNALNAAGSRSIRDVLEGAGHGDMSFMGDSESGWNKVGDS
jgi:hypothetical protein